MRLALGTAVLLTAAALVSPSVASAASRCAEPRVAGPAPRSWDYPEERERARRAPVVKVTDRNDSAHPVEVRYTHRPGTTTVIPLVPIPKDRVFHTVQVLPRAAGTHLWIRAEFSDVATDIELTAYSRHGAPVGYSESSNNDVVDAVFILAGFSDRGGPGYENLDGLPFSRCSALTVETKSEIVAVDSPTRLLLWLGPPAPKA